MPFMAQPKGSHFVITANETDSGTPVYLQEDGGWTRHLAQAFALDSEQERDALVAAAAAEQQRAVCDPYWFNVASNEQEIDPLSVREWIRANGPTSPLRRPD